MLRGRRRVLSRFSTYRQHPRGGQTPWSQIRDHNHTFKGKELATKLGSSAEVKGCEAGRNSSSLLQSQLGNQGWQGECRATSFTSTGLSLSSTEKTLTKVTGIKHTCQRAEEEILSDLPCYNWKGILSVLKAFDFHSQETQSSEEAGVPTAKPPFPRRGM